MSARFKWISKCNTRAQEILDSQKILNRTIQKLPGPGIICKFDYTVKTDNLDIRELMNEIGKVEIEPTFIYVSEIIDDVAQMKSIVLDHVKTIHPWIYDLITHIFQDGIMFVPVDRMLERVYIDLEIVDYGKYKGTFPISEAVSLTRYSFHVIGEDITEKLGDMYLVNDEKVAEDITFMNRALRDTGYFALNGSSQDLQLYKELGDLWGCEIKLLESDYICLRHNESSELIDYVPSFMTFFERVRDTFPLPPFLLIDESIIEFLSLYHLRYFLEFGELPAVEKPTPPANLEYSIYKDSNKTKLEVYQDKIFDSAYYDDSPETVEKKFLEGSLFTEWCRVTLTELNRISFYCLVRE